jgi:acyl-CoA thioesterase
MSDLRTDLALVMSGSRATTTVSPAWDFAVPNGGYLASLCLRAATEHMKDRVPSSLSATFVSSAASGREATLDVEVLRSTPRTAALHVGLAQEQRSIVSSTIWLRQEGVGGGLVHDVARRPDYPAPGDVPVVPKADVPRKAFNFYDNVEERQLPASTAAQPAPRWLAWYRFAPLAKYDEPTLDAARAVLLLDALAFPTAIVAHPGELCFAMTAQLDVHFCPTTQGEAGEWLLADLESPVSRDGVLLARGNVWTESGRLLASGQMKMLYMGPVMAR